MPRIEDVFPMENRDTPASYVSLPGGNNRYNHHPIFFRQYCQVPDEFTGLIIGKHGAGIKNLQVRKGTEGRMGSQDGRIRGYQPW